MSPPTLLSVPNVSEGSDAGVIAAIAEAFAAHRARPGQGEDGCAGGDSAPPVRLLDVHSDPDHQRSVFTLAAQPRVLADAVLRGGREVVRRTDVMAPGTPRGQHPHVGALDVVPIVYMQAADRGAACAEALLVADRIGSELNVPVFLYGDLAGGRTRAELRQGGVRRLAERMKRAHPDGSRGETVNGLQPDFGPPRMHPSAGAALVAAREPLVAFNVQLAPPASVEDARAIAARIREGGEQGLPGVRAIAVALGGGNAQVSTNVERPLELPLAAVLEAVARHAPVAGAELVGLAPSRALEGFPPDVALEGFDPARHVLENALGS
jgi:glutamate formiminotransferase